MTERRATRPYFAADPITLAQRLIGAALVRILPTGERLAGRIVETEAYCGPDDKAAHSVNGRRTPRTEPMFGSPGTTYVFLTYGMHHCFNIACGEEGEPVAVLIRALEPTEGIAAMHRLAERTATGKPRLRRLTDTDICKGPARLCLAMAIDRALNAQDLTRSPEILVEPLPAGVRRPRLVNTPRIGVDYAGDWADIPLRWHAEGSPCVSGPADGRRRRGGDDA